MNSRNNKIRELLNVDVWHKKGYTGKRGVSVSCESLTSSHGARVAEVFHEIAPDRELIGIQCHGKVDEHFFDEVIDTINERGVDTCTRSVTGPPKGDVFEKVKDFCTCFNSAGNEGMDGDSHAKAIISPYVYGVGAVNIDSSGKVTPTYYTSESEYVDFAAPASFYVDGYTQAGTSFSTPCVCGLAALVNDFFIDKTGRPLSSDNMYRFLKDHSLDIWYKGKDEASGWGVPILPDPDDIEIWEYQTVEVENKEEDKVEDKEPEKEEESIPNPCPVPSTEPEIEKEVDKLNIIETNWQWAYPLTYRNQIDEIILHHAAADGSAESVHNYHRSLGWNGIAYNYYVRKDGSIYRGRPENAIGGHTSNHNTRSIGICFEGNFEVEQMGEAQKEAGANLVADILSRYPNIKVLRHRDVDATACPGKYFPFEEVSEQMTGEQIYNKLVEFLLEKEESNWSKSEGHWKKATDMNVVDGENPRGFVSREQLTAILGRMGLLNNVD